MDYCHLELPNRTSRTASGLFALVFLAISLFPVEALLNSRSFFGSMFYAVYVAAYWLIAACFAFC